MFLNFNGHQLVLASASPRRQQFFKDLGLPFEVRLKPVQEVYPPHLEGADISDFLAQLKAEALRDTLAPKEILITSDTVVWHHGQSLAKPQDRDEAIAFLQDLSDGWHQVITSVCITTATQQHTVNAVTEVHFRALTQEEIEYYVNTYSPYDKAGGYGIQEWIGQVGITEIRGSYFNVMGLPTHLVHKALQTLVA